MRASRRMTGVAAALAATLLIAGCGSDDDGDDSPKSEESASDTQEKGGDENAPEEEPGTEVKAMNIQGAWTEGGGSGAVTLVVAEQKAIVTGKSAACSGEVVDSSQPATLDLKCPKGGDYAKGTFKSFDGEKLTVEWGSGQTSTFTKSKIDPGDLPDPNGPPGADDMP